MSILAIDTSTDRMGVALIDDERVRASYEVLGERPHGVELPQAVQRVLRAGGCPMDTLEGIAVDVGPGSFTGLRIGLAFVKALVFRTKTPVVGVASLEVLAAGVPFAMQTICPVLDAKQRNVYAAWYRTRGGALETLSEPELLPFQALLVKLRGPTILLGDGALRYRTQLVETLGKEAIFADPELGLPRAAILGRLGLARLQQGKTDDPKTLVPRYLYPWDSTVNPAARTLNPAFSSVPSPKITA